MPAIDPTYWSEHLPRTLRRYEEELLRRVAGRLARPRNQWPVDELIARCIATVENPAVLDRRLNDLDPAGRRLLALFGHSRQPRWRLGSLVELSMALGNADGLQPILNLFEEGLLYPDLPEERTRLKSFEQWLAHAGGTRLEVFTHPQVAERAIGVDLGLPDLGSEGTVDPARIHEADGLEWLLRLGVLWQQLAAAPFRRTQGGEFFKRDFDRLAQDPLLNGPPTENLAELPAPAFLTVALAEAEGLVQATPGELHRGTLPPSWEEGLLPALASLWTALPALENWNALDGWRGAAAGAGNPYPSGVLLALLLLARPAPEHWALPDDLEDWLQEHHPYWTGESVRPSQQRRWLGTFLLGVAYQLRLVQASQDATGAWQVRLSSVGRWLLGLAGPPTLEAVHARTLLVQPNLEILAYRQGLTPSLIGRLSRFATWKLLGSACTLQLEPETVYRALESGLTFEGILQTLEQHGTRTTPAPVVESLRTWSNKRDRISIYPSAALLEFTRAEDLDDALSRGLPAIRLSERLAVVTNESVIDYRHFRLTGTRDYSLPPEKCVEVESDGVTLTIDLTRSDLLLETEMPRFAEPLEQAGLNGRRQYRLTPASLAAGRSGGYSLSLLESWFLQRTGHVLSPAARLLLTGSQLPSPQFQRHLVLHLPNEETADGLIQWPETRSLIAARLGPKTVAVLDADAPVLEERLRGLGMTVLPAASPGVDSPRGP